LRPSLHDLDDTAGGGGEGTGVPTARDSTTVCGKFSQLELSSRASAALRKLEDASRGLRAEKTHARR
jgi:hypothetical protein